MLHFLSEMPAEDRLLLCAFLVAEVTKGDVVNCALSFTVSSQELHHFHLRFTG